MTIDPKLVIEYRDLYYDNDKPLLLMLVLLYHNGSINRESFLALCKQHKAGKMDRYIKTYHCKINDKWYSDQPLFDVYLDVFYKAGINKVDFKSILPHFMLYTGKGKNYTIDWFFYQFIEPLINTYINSGSYFSLNDWKINQIIRAFQTFEINFSSNLQTFSNYVDNYGASGYCCDDCDGDYETYGSYRYISDVIEPNKKSFRQDFSKSLNSFKDNSYLKNPKLIDDNFIL